MYLDKYCPKLRNKFYCEILLLKSFQHFLSGVVKVSCALMKIKLIVMAFHSPCSFF